MTYMHLNMSQILGVQLKKGLLVLVQGENAVDDE